MEQHQHFCVICGALVDEEVLSECMIQTDHAFGLCQECEQEDPDNGKEPPEVLGLRPC